MWQYSPEDVTALEARTEGWIAGLQLAALALQSAPTLSSASTPAGALMAAFTGQHHFVLDYLAEEVLSRQPEAVQHFLLQTSILDRLCGALCDAVTAGSAGEAQLQELQRQNLFLISLDAERQWYRYHHLFADLLKHRLEIEVGKDAEYGLHRKASEWYEDHGLMENAINHALAAKD